MEVLARALTRHAVVVLLATLALTVFAISRIVDFRTGQVHLVLDPSMDRLLAEGDEEKKFYDYVREVFGSDETLLISLAADDVFTPAVLESVVRMAQRIEELDGVLQVVSLATSLNIRSREDALRLEPFVEEVPQTRVELERLREEVLSNPIYAGNLVSSDAGATALLVYFEDMPELEFVARDLDAAITAIAEEERGDAEVQITGQPHIKVMTSRTLRSDVRRVLPAAFGIVMVISFVFFRMPRGVLVPITTVLISLIWTLAVIAWSGRALNLVTTIVPPLILVLGFAYSVHIVSSYLDALREREGGAAEGSSGEAAASPMFVALNEVALPVLLTGLTTIVGFMSLTLSSISAIREFGLFSVVGVACTLVASLSFAPAMLHVLPIPKRRIGQPGSRLFARAAERLGQFDLDRRAAVLAASGLLAVAALVGLSRLEITSDMIQNFPRESAVRRDFEAVNEHLEGANAFYVIVETDQVNAFREPANLGHLQELQVWLEAQPEIGGTTSIVDYVMLINRGFNDNDPAYLVVPDSQEVVAQLLLVGENDELWSYVDSEYRKASILVRSRTLESRPLAGLIRRIEGRLEELPEHLHARITGNSVLMTRAIDDIARGQVTSLTVAFVVIYGILVLLFASFRVGFVALIPNALPVLVFFGIMGLSGVTLTATTSLIACIVLGIAVDDSIHYLTHFNAASRRLASERKGTIAALRAVVRPVTVTTVAICIGFLALTLSELRNFVHFGALASATLAVAWLLDLTLTPALCSRLRIVSLWDVLSLDLGPDPHLSIPLFRGLSVPQARIVALLARIRSFPAGQRIMRTGEPGDEMYVVVEGKLEASVEREGGRTKLAWLTRGDIVGEVALFEGKRTADVDTVSEVRLLGLSRASLERLGRRYPRIALIVSNNLNEGLARRLALQTPRIR